MGKITIREASSVGESFSEVEYIFEDSSDYFAWSEQKTEALNNALKSYVGDMFTEPEGSDIFGNSEPAKPFIDIKKKAKETKH